MKVDLSKYKESEATHTVVFTWNRGTAKHAVSLRCTPIGYGRTGTVRVVLFGRCHGGGEHKRIKYLPANRLIKIKK